MAPEDGFYYSDVNTDEEGPRNLLARTAGKKATRFKHIPQQGYRLRIDVLVKGHLQQQVDNLAKLAVVSFVNIIKHRQQQTLQQRELYRMQNAKCRLLDRGMIFKNSA